ncbi:MAG: hypothetical protein ACF8PG_14555 [Maioricimonas sp. JB045]
MMAGRRDAGTGMSQSEFERAYRQTLIDGDLTGRCRLLVEAGLICAGCGERLGGSFVGHAVRCRHCETAGDGAVRPGRTAVPAAVSSPVSTSV